MSDYETAYAAAIRAIDDGGQMENGEFRISDERISSVIDDALRAFREHGWELQPVPKTSE